MSEIKKKKCVRTIPNYDYFLYNERDVWGFLNSNDNELKFQSLVNNLSYNVTSNDIAELLEQGETEITKDIYTCIVIAKEIKMKGTTA